MIKRALVSACVVISLVYVCDCSPPTFPTSPASSAPSASLVEVNSAGKPIVTCEVGGIIVRAPMYEDKEFSPEILKSDLEHMEVISESVVNVSRSFLIDEDKLRIKTKHLWQLKTVFDNLFNKFSEEDRYKEFAPDYCIKMADFVTKITGSYSENAIDNSEAHKRTEILMKSLEALVKASKGGIYLDYMNITIGGESFVQYMAPVVQRYRDNKLNWAIKMCNKIVKLAKVIIQVQTG